MREHTKNELLGLNKDGAYPARGIPVSKNKIAAADVMKPETIAIAQDHTRHHVGEHLAENHSSLSKASLGKPPKPKGYHVGVHSGMTGAQQAGHGVGGLAHPTSSAGALSDAARLESNPLARPAQGKVLTPVAYTPGMRPRDAHTPRNPDAWGARILADAHSRAAPDHPKNLGRLPQTVKSR